MTQHCSGALVVIFGADVGCGRPPLSVLSEAEVLGVPLRRLGGAHRHGGGCGRGDHGVRVWQGCRGRWEGSLARHERHTDVAHLQAVHLQAVALQGALRGARGPALAIHEEWVLHWRFHVHLENLKCHFRSVLSG